MGFSTPSSEQAAMQQISSACIPYYSNPNSVDAKNRLAERIQVYLQTVAKYGQCSTRGTMSGGPAVRAVFGIDESDSPIVRYNKISTFRV